MISPNNFSEDKSLEEISQDCADEVNRVNQLTVDKINYENQRH